jgi:hypothetical protein
VFGLGRWRLKELSIFVHLVVSGFCFLGFLNYWEPVGESYHSFSLTVAMPFFASSPSILLNLGRCQIISLFQSKTIFFLGYSNFQCDNVKWYEDACFIRITRVLGDSVSLSSSFCGEALYLACPSSPKRLRLTTLKFEHLCEDCTITSIFAAVSLDTDEMSTRKGSERD